MRKYRITLIAGLFIIIVFTCVQCGNTAGPLLGKETDDVEDTSSAPGKLVRPPSEPANFVVAARKVTPAVVHIRTMYESTDNSYNSMNQYRGSSENKGQMMGSASGVIITADGYIATNNHVVENASKVEVILPDKREFSAKIIGRDPNTDLALIKIDADSLPVVKYGNSDITEIGQWVLAIGYPFSLNTTVTAGIISAKARNIGIINRSGENNSAPGPNSAIESFIQTDAAINPGNSGGALVNTDGELIGINSAIASQTGSYAGYAFAIPANLAKKILNDLKKYGTVKRGVLGVSFPSPSVEEQYFAKQGLNPGSIKGVYITNVLDGSAAALGGLEEGDIIQSIDGVQLTSSSEFSERIARHQPGDVLKLTYLRKDTPHEVSVTLKSEEQKNVLTGNNGSLEKIYDKLGAGFAPLTNGLKQRFNLNSGVVVTKVNKDGFFDRIGILEGTIIAFINGKPISNPGDIDAAFLSAQSGMIQIFAVAPDGSKVVFNFSLGT